MVVKGRHSPFVKSVEDFWGAVPSLNAKLLKIFFKVFYFAQDLQTVFNICSQYETIL